MSMSAPCNSVRPAAAAGTPGERDEISPGASEGCRQALRSAEVRLTEILPQARHVYHPFAVRIPGRETVRAEFARRGIQTGVHYPVPCHRQPPLRQFASHPLPVTEQAARELLSLPIFPHMTDGQFDYVCEAPRDVLREMSAEPEVIDVK